MTALQQYDLFLTTAVPQPTAAQTYGLLLHLLGPALERETGAAKPLSLTQVEPSGSRLRFQVGVLTADLIDAFDPLTRLRDIQVPFGSGTATLHAVAPRHLAPLPYQALFDQEAVDRQFGLRFLSPTHFRHQGEPVLFPDPATLFGSLLARFNAHSPFRFPDDVLADLRRFRVVHYRLRTTTVSFPTHRITGFTGQVTYVLPSDSPPQIAYLAAALLRFACYSGVGARTHLGLGHVTLAHREVRA